MTKIGEIKEDGVTSFCGFVWFWVCLGCGVCAFLSF
jgi:Pyruvate/2-oxoacid:ferredoxin oxidoreductase delta subunit